MLLCNIVVILQFVSFPFTDWQVANNTSQIGGFFSSVNLKGTHATIAWVPLYKTLTVMLKIIGGLGIILQLWTYTHSICFGFCL